MTDSEPSPSPSPGLQLSIDPGSVVGHVWVRAVGPLTARTGAGLRELVVELVGAGRCRLVVDVSGVAEVDATGLGILVGAARRAQDGGGCLHLVDDAGVVATAVRRTGLSKVLRVAGGADDVLAGHGGRVDARRCCPPG